MAAATTGGMAGGRDGAAAAATEGGAAGDTAGAAAGAIAAGAADKFSLLDGERRCATREKFNMWKVMLVEQVVAGDDGGFGGGKKWIFNLWFFPGWRTKKEQQMESQEPAFPQDLALETGEGQKYSMKILRRKLYE